MFTTTIMVSHPCLLDTTSPRRPALGVSESWLANADPGSNKGTAAAIVEPGKFHNDNNNNNNNNIKNKNYDKGTAAAAVSLLLCVFHCICCGEI